MNTITENPGRTIGDRVKALREKRKIGRRELAIAINVSYTTLSDLECGRSKTTTYLHKIAKELKANIEWLETGSGPIDAPEISRYGAPDPEILKQVIRVMLRSIERRHLPLETVLDAEMICFTYDLVLREIELGAARNEEKPADNVIVFRRILSKHPKKGR